MFLYNFKYELKLLIRNKWIQVLSVIIIINMLFAGYNGKQKVDKRNADIENITNKVSQEDQLMLLQLDSIKQGHTVNLSKWRVPTSPMAVGNYHPRVAAMQPHDMAFVAIGQSDLFTHYTRPKVVDNSLTIKHTEMTSPVQLLFGSFDLAFVVIYLLPLIIIAFTYNILSQEKESGSLRLLASQPLSIRNWVLQKVILRFFWLVLITILVLTIVFVINEFSFSENLGAFVSCIILVVAYMMFWFALAFAINLFGKSSAKNAMSLLGLWIVFVLLIPAIMGQLSSSFYPIPSRTKMLNEMRALKAETTKKQDKILDNFLRDHPEYASKDDQGKTSFWHRYMASQRIINDELSLLQDKYDGQLRKQHELIQQFQYTSPAIIVQQSLNAMAGTSSTNYEDYRNQVASFAQQWQDFFIPLLYKNKEFTKEQYADFPKFTYQSEAEVTITTKIVVLVLFTLLITMIGWGAFRLNAKKGLVILS
ncbi:DUF3526 domain-containing protein [Aquimarina sp. I32.4]|uniref:DUF3526 domain-containing protein n=1 Tax=Aquimarina sp. I32.4 TaxID=2053903 RepID=UPI000CDEE611|nr:DUF3526 domain-containing protein [Aquimarina sp. I32.4]